jgi:hypothetical protein
MPIDEGQRKGQVALVSIPKPGRFVGANMSVRTLVKIDEIRQLIYSVRNTQVMLDKDLAVFYGVKPIRLREQVKRNLKRFPPDFMFQLTEKEVEFMVSQNAIPSKQHLGGSLPFVFTVYHFGASLKDLGKKWFAFSKMDIGAAEMLGKVGEMV